MKTTGLEDKTNYEISFLVDVSECHGTVKTLVQKVCLGMDIPKVGELVMPHSLGFKFHTLKGNNEIFEKRIVIEIFGELDDLRSMLKNCFRLPNFRGKKNLF